MATWRITLFFAGPILLPAIGPLVPDTALMWTQTVDEAFQRLPQDATGWRQAIDLPLRRDILSGEWAISALTFPDPGIVSPNTGYRNDPNSGDPTGNRILFTDKDASSGSFHSMIYDLTSWFTPRAQFLAETPTADKTDLTRLIARLAAVGLGRKTAAGYGAIRTFTIEDAGPVNACWDAGRPLRPVPVASLKHSLPSDVPRFLFRCAGPRWAGSAQLCYGPPVTSWHPVPHHLSVAPA